MYGIFGVKSDITDYIYNIKAQPTLHPAPQIKQKVLGYDIYMTRDVW